jgi:hypothetical protein
MRTNGARLTTTHMAIYTTTYTAIFTMAVTNALNAPGSGA